MDSKPEHKSWTLSECRKVKPNLSPSTCMMIPQWKHDFSLCLSAHIETRQIDSFMTSRKSSSSISGFFSTKFGVAYQSRSPSQPLHSHICPNCQWNNSTVKCCKNWFNCPGNRVILQTHMYSRRHLGREMKREIEQYMSTTFPTVEHVHVKIYAIFISLSSEFYLYIRWFLETFERNKHTNNNMSMSHYCQQLSNSVSLYARTLFLSDDWKSSRRTCESEGIRKQHTRRACGWNCIEFLRLQLYHKHLLKHRKSKEKKLQANKARTNEKETLKRKREWATQRQFNVAFIRSHLCLTSEKKNMLSSLGKGWKWTKQKRMK